MKTTIALLCLFCSTALAAPPVRIMTEANEEVCRQFLPQLEEPALNSLIHGDDLIFYDDELIVRAYQMSNTFQWAYHNLSAEPDPFGNGNREFPWDQPMGTDDVPEASVVRFMRLPPRVGGGVWPIVYFNDELPGTVRDWVQSEDTGGGLRPSGHQKSSWQWVYPAGTVFAELLMFNHEGYTYPYEIRFRTRTLDGWSVDVYRPCPTAADLVVTIKELRPDWANRPNLVSAIDQLEHDTTFAATRKTDTAGTAFDVTVYVDPLPQLNDDALVRSILLGSTWKSALGYAWRENAQGHQVFAPTNTGGFNIVPESYAGHLVMADSQNCMKCHEHTNVNVATFAEDRGWYGRIRGDDGIFSFHPVAEQSVDRRGNFRPARMRQDLLNSGVLEQYSADRHPPDRYRRIMHVSQRLFPAVSEAQLVGNTLSHDCLPIRESPAGRDYERPMPGTTVLLSGRDRLPLTRAG